MEFDFLGIFTLVTGVLFLILEIRQNNWMWLFQLLSSAAAMVSFLTESLYASSALNLYYVVMAFVGFVQWRKDEQVICPGPAPEETNSVIEPEEKAVSGGIHLRRLSLKVALNSLAVLILGTVALFFLLRFLNDPMSVTDAGVTVLSGIATWWLAKSYPEQWILWIVADALSAFICLNQGMTAMGILYIIYTISAVYGYWHWRKAGAYIE